MLIILPLLSGVGTAVAVYVVLGFNDALVAGGLTLFLMASLSLLVYVSDARGAPISLLDNTRLLSWVAAVLALIGLTLVVIRAVAFQSEASLATVVFAAIALIGAVTLALQVAMRRR
jgi:hypothetical protein